MIRVQFQLQDNEVIYLRDPNGDVVDFVDYSADQPHGDDGHPCPNNQSYARKIDGFGELFRYISYDKIKTSALQSRACAGVSNATYIFCLPGSPSACKDAWSSIITFQLSSTHKPCNLVELIDRLK